MTAEEFNDSTLYLQTKGILGAAMSVLKRICRAVHWARCIPKEMMKFLLIRLPILLTESTIGIRI